MPAVTRYLFAVSMDVAADKEAFFNEIYDTEHVPCSYCRARRRLRSHDYHPVCVHTLAHCPDSSLFMPIDSPGETGDSLPVLKRNNLKGATLGASQRTMVSNLM